MYDHDLRELNQYTGLFSMGCFIALFCCCYAIGLVGNAIHHFHLDYRKANRLDEQEESESSE